MQNFEQWHQQSLKQIESRISELLNLPSNCTTLIESIRYSCLDGGKRIRPFFTIAAGHLSNADLDTTLTIGSAVELIHCFSLIHDDLPIMDNDDLRRGKPTNHKIYGDAVALLAGDALNTLCFEVLSSEQLNLPAINKLNIINLLARSIGLQGMVGGQTIDWLSTGKNLTLNQLQKMHSLKTGALLRASILSGYLAGTDVNPEQYSRIDLIAQKIGLLFQIVDDIIDVTEDTATLGKTANKDHLQDKATYVSLLGLEQAQESAKNLHQEIIDLIQQQPNSQILKFLADNVCYRNS